MVSPTSVGRERHHLVVPAGSDLPEAVDARAGAPRHADLVFIFGTRLPTPAHVAAGLYHNGLSPVVLLTGGSARQDDGLNEARHHHGLPCRSRSA